MENMTVINVLLFMLGIALNILFEIQTIRANGKPFILIDILINLLLSIFSGVALLIFGTDIFTFMGVVIPDAGAMIYKFHAFFVCGIMPLPMIKRLIGLYTASVTPIKKVFSKNGNGS